MSGRALWGVGKELSREQWRSVFRQLAALGRRRGVGAAKLERHGDAFLAIIAGAPSAG